MTTEWMNLQVSEIKLEELLNFWKSVGNKRENLELQFWQTNTFYDVAFELKNRIQWLRAAARKMHAFVVCQFEVKKPEKYQWKEKSKFTNQVCWSIKSKIRVWNDFLFTGNKFDLKPEKFWS